MKRLPRDQEKELVDQARLLRAWKQLHREQLDDALTGAHGARIAELVTVLDRLELNSAAVLLDVVQRTDWNAVSYDARLEALHRINDAISRMRERHGMPPIDDGVPGGPDNVFRIVRSILTPSPAKAGSCPSEVATAERIGRDVTATVRRKSEAHE